MFNRLNQHLQVNGILIPEQFGYRKGISIEKPIFNLVDNISLDQQLQIGGIFYDLTKAFDCVYHEILLKKLYCYGICDTLALYTVRIEFFSRHSFVLLNGTSSDNI
jgi:hypothetical protein